MEIFKASVQYNDSQGSCAADRADNSDASDWLAKNGLINNAEFVVGISMFAGVKIMENIETLFQSHFY
jgi:hypothetical protein